MNEIKTEKLKAISGGRAKPQYTIDGPPLSDQLFRDIKDTFSLFFSPDLFKNDLVIQTRPQKDGSCAQLWSFYDPQKSELVSSYRVDLRPDGWGGTYFNIIL